MKILVISQYYYPEPFRITDICETLVERGHEVTVVTGVPNYPMGTLYEGYEKCTKKVDNINGVQVIRCIECPRKKGVVFRLLNYYSYSFSSTKKIRELKELYDVVFVYQLSPVMLAKAGIHYKKRKNRKVVLYCLDLWPESLLVGGIKRNSIIYNVFYQISKKIYSEADKILVTSKSFIEYFEREFSIQNVQYLPQYAEEIYKINKKGKIKKSTTDLLFAGNIGKAQSIETIIKAANETKALKDLIWRIVGDGIELENIKGLTKKLGLENVVFYGRKDINEMPKFYEMADAMLLTLEKNTAISLTVPGKMQSYMAAGKPILGAIDGEARRIIEESQCGFCVSAEDYIGLANIAKKFYYSDEKDRFASNSVKYYDIKFSKNYFIDEIESVLKNESITN